MVNPSKNKGTSWETAIVKWLQANGYPLAKRNPPAGSKDIGDVSGLPVAIEAKSCAKLEFSKWVAEANVEGERSGMPGVVIAKRRGKGSPADAYIVMDGTTFLRVLRRERQ